MTDNEVAKLCAFIYRQGYQDAVEVLKGSLAVVDEEKMANQLMNKIKQSRESN